MLTSSSSEKNPDKHAGGLSRSGLRSRILRLVYHAILGFHEIHTPYGIKNFNVRRIRT